MMEQEQLNEILEKEAAKAYFIGIGGIAMSAAACVAKEFGLIVEGSDSKEMYSPAKEVLNKAKLNVHAGYDAENVKKSGADLFILSAGEGPQNPEVNYVLQNNLPRIGFPELLFKIAEEKLRLVVTGTHGKTTTAGLLGHILKNLDDSSFITGGVIRNYEKNFSVGDGHYFVFEGDEYKTEFDDPTPKFHYYRPDILVLTNLEYDHPDIFSSLGELENEFAQLISNLPEDGLLVYNADNAALARLVHNTEVAKVSFAIDNEADYKVEQIKYGKEYTSFEVANKFSKNISAQLLGQTEEYKIQLPGKMNVYNALGAIAALRALGFSQEDIQLDLLSFQGVKRRFENIGVKKGVTLIDDYAHHPTAVRETLDAARLRYPNSSIWAIFEPHTFSRTKATLSELATAFDSADNVLISDIYPAREKASEATISAKDVIEAIRSSSSVFSKEGVRESSKNVGLVHNKQEALEILIRELKDGDVAVIMAVGDFNRLAYELKEKL